MRLLRRRKAVSKRSAQAFGRLHKDASPDGKIRRSRGLVHNRCAGGRAQFAGMRAFDVKRGVLPELPPPDYPLPDCVYLGHLGVFRRHHELC
jgi:hypothetical protein